MKFHIVSVETERRLDGLTTIRAIHLETGNIVEITIKNIERNKRELIAEKLAKKLPVGRASDSAVKIGEILTWEAEPKKDEPCASPENRLPDYYEKLGKAIDEAFEHNCILYDTFGGESIFTSKIL
jgi:hypothetical protein